MEHLHFAAIWWIIICMRASLLFIFIWIDVLSISNISFWHNPISCYVCVCVRVCLICAVTLKINKHTISFFFFQYFLLSCVGILYYFTKPQNDFVPFITIVQMQIRNRSDGRFIAINGSVPANETTYVNLISIYGESKTLHQETPKYQDTNLMYLSHSNNENESNPMNGGTERPKIWYNNKPEPNTAELHE